MSFIDYYNILGVTENATVTEIQKSFRELAKKYHPDKNNSPDAPAKFRELFEAYKILKNEDSRRFFNFKRSNYYKTKVKGVVHVNYTEKQYHADKEQAQKTAEECSKMTFDDFIKSSLFLLKKTTINLSIILMFLFGIFMCCFSFFILAKADNIQVGVGAMLFGLLVGATLIYIAQKDYRNTV